MHDTRRNRSDKSGVIISLYNVLNHTKTRMGDRLLRAWLQQPLTNIDIIRERHEVVSMLVVNTSTRCAVRDGIDCLFNCPDLEKLGINMQSFNDFYFIIRI